MRRATSDKILFATARSQLNDPTPRSYLMAEALGGKLLENVRGGSLSNGGTPRLGLEFRELEGGVGNRDPLNTRSKQQPHEDGALLAM